MKTVTYFYGGTVADFVIPDDRFEDFVRHVTFDARYDADQLDRARLVLERFVKDDQDHSFGATETVAACFVWNFFNTNPDDTHHIKGDIVIVDLEGNGAYVEYTSPEHIKLAPAN